MDAPHAAKALAPRSQVAKDKHKSEAESPDRAKSSQQVESHSKSKRKRKNKRRGIKKSGMPPLLTLQGVLVFLFTLNKRIVLRERDLNIEISTIKMLEFGPNSPGNQEALKALHKRRLLMIKRLTRTKEQYSMLHSLWSWIHKAWCAKPEVKKFSNPRSAYNNTLKFQEDKHHWLREHEDEASRLGIPSGLWDRFWSLGSQHVRGNAFIRDFEAILSRFPER